MDVGDGAVRGQPPALVARRRAIAALVDGKDVEPGVDERVHEGPPLALDLQIEIGKAAPGPPMEQTITARGCAGFFSHTVR